MEYATRKILNEFKPRSYQLPIVDAIENKGYKRVVAILPRRCVAKGTNVTTSDGSEKLIQHVEPGDKILSFNGDRVVTDIVNHCWYVGKKKAIEIRSPKFLKIVTSKDHLFY